MVATHRANPYLRVLGVDPAAAGPTGYGIVESDGRRCKMLHYGAFRVPTKRQKEFSGAALQDVHALLCRLIEEFAPDVMAVESVFTALKTANTDLGVTVLVVTHARRSRRAPCPARGSPSRNPRTPAVTGRAITARPGGRAV